MLVFTLIFAILEKTKILGDGQKRIDAIIALVVGLLLVGFAYPTHIIANLMPFLAVSAVVLLVFFILFAFVWGGKEGFEMPKGVKIALGILIAISVIIAVLAVSGYWEIVVGFFSNSIATGIFVVAVVAAMVAVLWGTGKK